MTSNIRANCCAVILLPPEIHRSGAIWLNGLGADKHALLPMVSALGLPDNHGYKFVFPHVPMQSAIGFIQRVGRSKARLPAPKASSQNPNQIEFAIQPPKSNTVRGCFSKDGAMTLFAGLRCPDRLDDEAPLSTCTPLTAQILSVHDYLDVGTPAAIDDSLSAPVLALSLSSTSTHRLRALGYVVDAQDAMHQNVLGTQQIQSINHWLRQALPLWRQPSIWRRMAASSKRTLLDRLMRRPALLA